MSMTHYMELLATNQPWNLLLFMAVPVILAETLAVSELAVLLSRGQSGTVRTVNRWSGILAGAAFAVIFVHLMLNAVIPITAAGEWRGPLDVIAVGFYLFGIVPLGGVALLELGVIGRGLQDKQRLGFHAALVGLFLITAHIAMIAGMLDPALLTGGAGGAHGAH